MADKLDLKVSMFQIPESLRAGLLKVSAQSVIDGDKRSVNTCILDALNDYLNMPEDEQPHPQVNGTPLRRYTVRLSDEIKSSIATTAAKWQIKKGLPVPMNAVVNTAISIYLQKHLK